MTIARNGWGHCEHPSLLAVAQLDDLVLRNVSEGIRQRRLAPEVHTALQRVGVYQMLVPSDAGGDDVPYPVALRVIERLARVDGSVAWCAVIGAATASFGASLPPGVAEATMWRDPNEVSAAVFIPNGRATPVDGGYRVSGRWPFASGCSDAAWFVGQCLIASDGVDTGTGPAGGDPASTPTHRMMAMPMDELRMFDTWHAAGLRATGSHDVEAADVFVPSERAFVLGAPDPRRQGPLTRFPFRALLTSSLAAVSAGLARAAADTLADTLAQRAKRLERGVDGLLGSAVLELAVLEASARSARTALFSHVDALWDAVVAGEEELEVGSIEVQLASRHAVAQAADAATRAHHLGGAAALHEEHPLQRAARDAQAVAQHGLFGLAPHEALGRTLVSMRAARREAIAA